MASVSDVHLTHHLKLGEGSDGNSWLVFYNNFVDNGPSMFPLFDSHKWWFLPVNDPLSSPHLLTLQEYAAVMTDLGDIKEVAKAQVKISEETVKIKTYARQIVGEVLKHGLTDLGLATLKKTMLVDLKQVIDEASPQKLMKMFKKAFLYGTSNLVSAEIQAGNAFNSCQMQRGQDVFVYLQRVKQLGEMVHEARQANNPSGDILVHKRCVAMKGRFIASLDSRFTELKHLKEEEWLSNTAETLSELIGSIEVWYTAKLEKARKDGFTEIQTVVYERSPSAAGKHNANFVATPRSSSNSRSGSRSGSNSRSGSRSGSGSGSHSGKSSSKSGKSGGGYSSRDNDNRSASHSSRDNRSSRDSEHRGRSRSSGSDRSRSYGSSRGGSFGASSRGSSRGSSRASSASGSSYGGSDRKKQVAFDDKPRGSGKSYSRDRASASKSNEKAHAAVEVDNPCDICTAAVKAGVKGLRPRSHPTSKCFQLNHMGDNRKSGGKKGGNKDRAYSAKLVDNGSSLFESFINSGFASGGVPSRGHSALVTYTDEEISSDDDDSVGIVLGVLPSDSAVAANASSNSESEESLDSAVEVAKALSLVYDSNPDVRLGIALSLGVSSSDFLAAEQANYAPPPSSKVTKQMQRVTSNIQESYSAQNSKYWTVDPVVTADTDGISWQCLSCMHEGNVGLTCVSCDRRQKRMSRSLNPSNRGRLSVLEQRKIAEQEAMYAPQSQRKPKFDPFDQPSGGTTSLRALSPGDSVMSEDDDFGILWSPPDRARQIAAAENRGRDMSRSSALSNAQDRARDFSGPACSSNRSVVDLISPPSMSAQVAAARGGSKAKSKPKAAANPGPPVKTCAKAKAKPRGNVQSRSSDTQSHASNEASCGAGIKASADARPSMTSARPDSHVHPGSFRHDDEPSAKEMGGMVHLVGCPRVGTQDCNPGLQVTPAGMTSCSARYAFHNGVPGYTEQEVHDFVSSLNMQTLRRNQLARTALLSAHCRALGAIRDSCRRFEPNMSAECVTRTHSALHILDILLAEMRRYFNTHAGLSPREIHNGLISIEAGPDDAPSSPEPVAEDVHIPPEKKPPLDLSTSFLEYCYHLTEDQLRQCIILFDSGCTSHLFKKLLMSLFPDATRLTNPRLYKGISGEVAADYVGSNDYFKNVHFSEDASASLASLAKLEDDGFEVSIVKGVITCENGDHQLIFKRSGDLYPLVQINKSLCSDEDVAYSASHASSIVIDPGRWTKAQIKGALAYRKFHLCAGCMARGKEIAMMKRGGWTGCKFTIKDMHLADQILVQCQTCLLTKRRKVRKKIPYIYSTIIGAVLHCDYFFLRLIDNSLWAFILFVDEASQRCLVQDAHNRNTPNFKLAFTQTTGFFVRNSFAECSVLICDKEGAVAAFSRDPSFMGKVKQLPSGTKDTLSERFNGIIKSILYKLIGVHPYRFPQVALRYAVKESANLLSIRPNDSPHTICDGVAPCELVDGYKMDVSNLEIPYGSYVLAVTPSVKKLLDTKRKSEPVNLQGVKGILVSRPFGGVKEFRVLVISRENLGKPTYVLVSEVIPLAVSKHEIDQINALTECDLAVDLYVAHLLQDENYVSPDAEVGVDGDGDTDSVADFYLEENPFDIPDEVITAEFPIPVPSLSPTIAGIRNMKLSTSSPSVPELHSRGRSRERDLISQTPVKANLWSDMDAASSEVKPRLPRSAVKSTAKSSPVIAPSTPIPSVSTVPASAVRPSAKVSSAKVPTPVRESTSPVFVPPSYEKVSDDLPGKAILGLPPASLRPSRARSSSRASNDTDFVYQKQEKLTKAEKHARSQEAKSVKMFEKALAAIDIVGLVKKTCSVSEGMSETELIMIAHSELREVMEFAYSVANFANQKKSQYSINAGIKKFESTAVLSIRAEIKAILDKDIMTPKFWSSLTQAQKKKVIISFTFLKEKTTVEGDFKSLKARLVAGGHMIDADGLDISSPTVKTESVFLLHGIAARKGMSITCMDIVAAFLNTKLAPDDEVLMLLGLEETRVLLLERPEWKKYVRSDGKIVVSLNGGLYGLPQASKLWYDHLSSTILRLGYMRCEMDECVFIKFDRKGKMSVLCIHVDDIMHTHESDHFQVELHAAITAEYGTPTVQSGPSGIYVGVEYCYDGKGGVTLSMGKYIRKLCEAYDVKVAQPSPCKADLMEPDNSSAPCDRTPFASLVMALYYAAMRVRPDILFTVNYLSTKSQNPSMKDYKAAERVLQYLYGTIDVGLVIKPSGLRLHFYVDASFMIHPDGRSHTGSVFCLGGDIPGYGLDGAIFSRTSVQKFITVSSTEAEICAVFQLHQWYEFYRLFLEQLRIPVVKPLMIMQDNDAAILNFAKGFRGRTKPLNLRYHYIHELVVDGKVEFFRCDTDKMLADPLTKPFYSPTVHTPLLQRLMNDRNWYDKASIYSTKKTISKSSKGVAKSTKHSR